MRNHRVKVTLLDSKIANVNQANRPAQSPIRSCAFPASPRGCGPRRSFDIDVLSSHASREP